MKIANDRARLTGSGRLLPEADSRTAGGDGAVKIKVLSVQEFLAGKERVRPSARCAVEFAQIGPLERDLETIYVNGRPASAHGNRCRLRGREGRRAEGRRVVP